LRRRARIGEPESRLACQRGMAPLELLTRSETFAATPHGETEHHRRRYQFWFELVTLVRFLTPASPEQAQALNGARSGMLVGG